MRRLTFPIKGLLLASALVLVPSCGGEDNRVLSLPPAPQDIERAQANDARPAYPDEALTSEAAHEAWTDDALDWGDRRNLLAYRWCQLWNTFAEVKSDCGPKPEGVE